MYHTRNMDRKNGKILVGALLNNQYYQLCFLLLVCLSTPFTLHAEIAEPSALHSANELELTPEIVRRIHDGISEKDKEILYLILEDINGLLENKLDLKIKFTRSNYFSAKPNCGSLTKPGEILIGPHKFYKFKDRPKIVLELLFAHEVAHILHFLESKDLATKLCQRKDLRVKDIELLADFIAGFLLQKIKGVTHKDLQRASMLIISEHSDYQISNSQNHHGTVVERINAVNYGRAVASLDMPFNFPAFASNIKTLKRNLGGIPFPELARSRKTLSEEIRRKSIEMYQ